MAQSLHPYQTNSNTTEVRKLQIFSEQIADRTATQFVDRTVARIPIASHAFYMFDVAAITPFLFCHTLPYINLRTSAYGPARLRNPTINTGTIINFQLVKSNWSPGRTMGMSVDGRVGQSLYGQEYELTIPI